MTIAQPPRRWWRRAFLATAALCLLLVAGLIVFHERILGEAGRFLIAPSPEINADIGYILGGSRSARADLAATLFHQGKVKRLLITKTGGLADVDGVVLLSEQDLLVRMLVALGVPENRMERLDHESSSTEEEAQALARYLDQHEGRKVAIITNDIHTRRCRWTFRRAMGPRADELQYAGCPSGPASQQKWWKTPDGATFHVLEWMKLAAMIVR